MPRQAGLNRAIQDPRLPSFYAITAPLEADGSGRPILELAACRDWLTRFAGLLDNGIELVQLRAKALDEDQLRALAARCRDLCASRGVRLLLNGPAEVVRALGLDGQHLTTKRLVALQKRPLGPEYLVGASCHSPEELEQAARIGADFACLSPLRPVAGYGEREPLGFGTFAAWLRRCPIPVYALGGLRRDDLAAVREAGGQGVAGISAFWG